MLVFALKRFASALLVMFAISVLVFLIFFATPGSTRRHASRAATPTRPPSPRCGTPSAWTGRCRSATC